MFAKGEAKASRKEPLLPTRRAPSPGAEHVGYDIGQHLEHEDGLYSALEEAELDGVLESDGVDLYLELASGRQQRPGKKPRRATAGGEASTSRAPDPDRAQPCLNLLKHAVANGTQGPSTGASLDLQPSTSASPSLNSSPSAAHQPHPLAPSQQHIGSSATPTQYQPYPPYTCPITNLHLVPDSLQSLRRDIPRVSRFGHVQQLLGRSAAMHLEQLLSQDQPISDVVMDAALQLVHDQVSQGHPRVMLWHSTWYQSLLPYKGSYATLNLIDAALNGGLDSTDFFSMDLVVTPVQLPGGHWVLLAWDILRCTASVYDSQPSCQAEHVDAVLACVREFTQWVWETQRRRRPWPPGWQFTRAPQVVQQPAGSADSGLYALTAGALLMRSLHVTGLKQEHVSRGGRMRAILFRFIASGVSQEDAPDD